MCNFVDDIVEVQSDEHVFIDNSTGKLYHEGNSRTLQSSHLSLVIQDTDSPPAIVWMSRPLRTTFWF